LKPLFQLGEKNFYSTIIRFASSQVFSNIVTLLSGVWVMRLIEPAQYGIFSGYQNYLGYVVLAQFGVLNGMNREIPRLVALGHTNSYHDVVNSSFTISCVIGLCSGILFIVWSGVNYSSGLIIDSMASLTLVIVSSLYIFNSLFFPFLFRTNEDFNKFANIKLVIASVNVLTIYIVYTFGFLGLCLRAMCISIITFIVYNRISPAKFRLKVKKPELLGLYKIGFPIFLAGRIMPLWTTILNNIVLITLGAANYGFYSISLLILGTLSVLSQSLSQIIYPRMISMYSNNVSVREIIKAHLKPIFTMSLIISVSSLVIYLLLPILISTLLPAYEQGLDMARVAVFIPVFSTLSIVSNIYNVVGSQKVVYTAQLFSIILGSTFLLIVSNIFGFQSIYIIWSMLISAAAQAMIFHAHLYWKYIS
jgi:O-antigen/teichoic acid export membrane protein